MPFLTAKSLPRRTVLRGLGATLALPFLDGMVPGRDAARARPGARAPLSDLLRPQRHGHGILAAERRRPQLRAVAHPRATGAVPGSDARAVGASARVGTTFMLAHRGRFLTGTTRGGRTEVEVIADVSMDQLLARHFARDTQVASLEISLDGPANAGACTGILSCAYTHTISWRSPTEPLPMEYNPRAVFEKLFGDSGSTGSGRARGQDAPAQKHPRLRVGQAGDAEAGTGTAGPAQGRRLHRIDSRRRAAHPEGRGAVLCGAAVDGTAPGACRRPSKTTSP